MSSCTASRYVCCYNCLRIQYGNLLKSSIHPRNRNWFVRIHRYVYVYIWASQVAQWVKNLPVNAVDAGDSALIPGSGRSPEKGMATHSSILAWRIPMDWWATVHRVTKSRTWLKQLSMHTCISIYKLEAKKSHNNRWTDELSKHGKYDIHISWSLENVS